MLRGAFGTQAALAPCRRPGRGTDCLLEEFARGGGGVLLTPTPTPTTRTTIHWENDLRVHCPFADAWSLTPCLKRPDHGR